MSKLEKFNETISDLNKEVEELKGASTAYKKLKDLHDSFNGILSNFDKNSKKLDEIFKLHKEQTDLITIGLQDINSYNRDHKKEFDKEFELKFENLKKDNKQFYKDLNETLKLKLDENLSLIRQLIESERSHIKQLIELEFYKNTQDLKNEFSNKLNEQNLMIHQNNLVIKYLLIGFGLINLIASIFIILK